jgi:L-aminopeptidase/D-esterase-like protein
MDLYPGSLTDVPGIRIGHATDLEALTGCTVILCPEGTVGGGVVRGYAPGTRETALLQPGMLVDRVHAFLLTGGSAFGLAAADGVMQCLEAQGVGYDTGVARVPIVPGAVLFDLAVGSAAVRPDAAMGRAACEAATTPSTAQGNIGAGTGATVGKLAGMGSAFKGGLGMASLRHGDLIVAALVAVNALGNVIDPDTGAVIAGARRPGGGWIGIMDLTEPGPGRLSGNTAIGVVATNARLDVAGANRLAHAGHDGLARVVRPSHTLYDGDTLFCACTGQVDAEPVLLAEMAARATAWAIVNGVLAARPAGGLPAAAGRAANRKLA